LAKPPRERREREREREREKEMEETKSIGRSSSFRAAGGFGPLSLSLLSPPLFFLLLSSLSLLSFFSLLLFSNKNDQTFPCGI